VSTRDVLLNAIADVHSGDRKEGEAICDAFLTALRELAGDAETVSKVACAITGAPGFSNEQGAFCESPHDQAHAAILAFLGEADT